MSPAKKRPPSAAQISNSTLEKATLALQALPEKPKENLSLRETIFELQGIIRAALDKGYTYEDIAALLNNQGVSIAPSSLRYYINQTSRSIKSTTRAKGTPRTPRIKAASLASPSSDSAPVSTSMAEAEVPVVEAQPEVELVNISLPAEENAPAKRTTQRSSRSTASTTSKTAAKRKAEPKTKVAETLTVASEPETPAKSSRAKSKATPAKTKTATTTRQRKRA